MKKGIRNRSQNNLDRKMQDLHISKEKTPLLSVSSIKAKDRYSIFILLLLYTLQGIPMGLCGSIPLILKEKGISYEGLSLFSLVSLPFSFKLLWAPIVDSCYFDRIGRRKSWLLPIQMLTAIFMIVGSQLISHWIGDSLESQPQIQTLTLFFFALYFLMATQDIAVDGWALTMLSKENVSMASTCNAIGQPFGAFLANQGFIALSDSRWCHRMLGLPVGTSLINLSQFMQFWGWVFVVVTILIGVFKSEEPIENPEDEPAGLAETYQQIWALCKLKPIRQLAVILLTCKVAFAASDSISGFKLQEYGMPKSDFASASPFLLIASLLLPALFSNAMSSRPLDLFLKGLPLKMLGSLCIWALSQYTHAAYFHSSSSSTSTTSSSLTEDDEGAGLVYFVLFVAVMLFLEVGGNLVFVSMMSFFAKVSDPAIGGTYMTFLNTLANLGYKWPNSLALYFLPKVTFYRCVAESSSSSHSSGLSVEGGWFEDVSSLMTKNWSKMMTLLDPSLSSCSPSSSTASHSAVCSISSGVSGSGSGASSGVCEMVLDGYTLLTFCCLVVGVLWLFLFRKTLEDLQNTSPKDWALPPTLAHSNFHHPHQNTQQEDTKLSSSIESPSPTPSSLIYRNPAVTVSTASLSQKQSNKLKKGSPKSK